MSKEFDVDEIMGQLEKELQVVLREVGVRVASAVILFTPIGRPDLWLSPPPRDYQPGTARGNWRAGIGRVPTTSEIDVQDPAGANTISLAQTVIRTWDGKRDLYISNAADHIVPLDDGTASRQTNGPGFVAKAVKAGIAAVNRVAQEVP